MLNFDRMFEGAIAWITLIVILLSLTYSFVTHADEYTNIPQSVTRKFQGQKYECFDTENYREIVQYVRVIVPELQESNRTLILALEETQNELEGWQDTARVLDHKLDIMKLDLLATTTELDEVKYQARDYRKAYKRTTVVHYIVHGLAFAAIISLGTAYGLERIK